MRPEDLWIPESHQDKTLDNFDWTDYPNVQKAVESILVERTPGMFLFGDPGLGKTHILVGIFRKFVDQGLLIGNQVTYTSWSALMNELHSYQIKGKVTEVAVDAVCKTDILILDDVRPGWGRVWGDVLKRVIENMYDNHKTWIVSTNVSSVKDLIDKWQLEDYWLSRMRDIVKFVHMKGKDRRGLKP